MPILTNGSFLPLINTHAHVTRPRPSLRAHNPSTSPALALERFEQEKQTLLGGDDEEDG